MKQGIYFNDRSAAQLGEVSSKRINAIVDRYTTLIGSENVEATLGAAILALLELVVASHPKNTAQAWMARMGKIAVAMDFEELTSAAGVAVDPATFQRICSRMKPLRVVAVLEWCDEQKRRRSEKAPCTQNDG